MLLDWIPDDAARHKALVENPAQTLRLLTVRA
jgi:hypothetical protein